MCVVGDVFYDFTTIESSITTPSYKSREVALDTVTVAVPNGKAVLRNCFITYGGSRRTRSGDAACGELRALDCIQWVSKRNSGVRFLLGGPGTHDNDSSLASYLDIYAKGLLVGLSGDLD